MKNTPKIIIQKILPPGSPRFEFYQILKELLSPFKPLNIQYRKWIKKIDPLNTLSTKAVENEIANFPYNPLISIILPVYNPNLDHFRQAVTSVQKQYYENWELCIADDASDNPRIRQEIIRFSEQDQRIKYIFREKNGHISAASNSALSLAGGDYIALLDHDDKLHPLALFFVAKKINEHPDCEIVYSDEDKITRFNTRVDPYFKPDFDYDLLLNQNYMIHLSVYRKATIKAIGGFRLGYEGSQDYDLNLRVLDRIDKRQVYHIPLVLYHWRMSTTSSAGHVNIKPYAADAAKKALSDHLQRNNVKGEIAYNSKYYSYKPNYFLPETYPSVEIIIFDPGFEKSSPALIQSILDNTDYENFSIHLLTDPLSDDQYFNNETSYQTDPRVTITKHSKKERLSFDLNRIVKTSKAKYFCLLDANIQSMRNPWLGKLISMAAQKGVGAVSPKLTFEDGIIYSSGIILDIYGFPQHLFQNLPVENPGYRYWAVLQKGYTALSDFCILFGRESFQMVEGFNENLVYKENFVLDFCLKLKHKQLRNILLPEVIINVQTNTKNNQQRSMEEQDLYLSELDTLKKRWVEYFEQDPHFNPNLTISNKGKIKIKS